MGRERGDSIGVASSRQWLAALDGPRRKLGHLAAADQARRAAAGNTIIYLMGGTVCLVSLAWALAGFELGEGGDAGVVTAVSACLATIVGILVLLALSHLRTSLLQASQAQTRELSQVIAEAADDTRMLAHEFSSPVGAIRGFSELLIKRRLGEEDQLTALAGIRAEAAILSALVEDLTAAGALERRSFHVAPLPVPLHTIIAHAAAFAETLPGEHPIERPDVVSGKVWADPDRIGQVLRNLLVNAAKFSPPGAPIALRVTRRDDTHVRIEVADHGPGIDPEDLERIFSKYERGSRERVKGVHGSGLGLYICQYIVSEHRSRLTLESTVGMGSTFAFDLEVVLS